MSHGDRSPPTRRRILAGLAAVPVTLPMLLAGSGSGAAAPRVPRVPPPPVRFDVIREGTVIGSHEVDFKSVDDGYQAVTRIDIAVRVLGIKAFVYKHHGTETWVGGRLQAFDSETDDDDSRFFVVGRASPDGFRITNRKGEEVAPADIMVASYWTPEIARQTLLIDAQRGRLKTQRLLATERTEVPVGGTTVAATRFRLTGVTDGWVTYDGDGRWLAADLKKKGSDILYRLRA